LTTMVFRSPPIFRWGAWTHETNLDLKSGETTR